MERFSALVLSRDVDVVRVINKALEEYGLEANIARNVYDANELLKDRRFDLAVCDYDLPGTRQLAYLEPNSAWRGMVFALVRPTCLNEIHGQRVHLTLPKPISPGLFGKGLKAAYTTMAQVRRASLRYPLDVQTSLAELIDKNERRTLPRARVLNISRTGMCLQTDGMLSQHATVRVTFDLTSNGGLVGLTGIVVWTKASGQSGIKFTNVSALAQKRLDEWINTKIPGEFASV
jgi:hypothetical protein